MSRIADLELLVRTADLGSLTAAAKALDMSPAGASAAIKRLETQWGVALFVRSTRSLRLSAEGERLMPHLRQALEALAQARAVATGARRSTVLQGELQLALPSDLGRNLLQPHLEAFQQRHPKLALRLLLSDRNTDLMRAPVDIALRYGAPSDSAQVALPLVPDNRRLLVASPAYIARQGIPASPAELSQHEALRFMLGDELPKTWRLQIGGEWQDLPLTGRHSANDGEMVKRWALAGIGIAYKSKLDVSAELRSGQLVHLHPDWLGEPSPLYLVVPGRRQLTPAARALRDWLLPRLNGQDSAPA
ncbi:MAG: LysR family transcriptional regulator [Burkholderiaceae bacterium]|nr:LysR family transcriptional regulator [Burkholderiaceae bacterium]